STLRCSNEPNDAATRCAVTSNVFLLRSKRQITLKPSAYNRCISEANGIMALKKKLLTKCGVAVGLPQPDRSSSGGATANQFCIDSNGRLALVPKRAVQV